MRKKIAFVDGNRAINENNVEKHVESLKEFGKNLVPLLYVDATEVGNRKIFDAITDEEVKPEQYGDYCVVLDGQHRYKAALRLTDSDEANGFTLDNLKWEKVDLNGKSFEDILIEVNTRTQPWKGADYINGCILHEPDNEVFRFAKELTDLGLSAKTVNKYLFFEDRMSWAAVMSDSSKLKDADMYRAMEIWNVAKKFPERIRKRSTIIDYVIDNGGKAHWQVELEKIKALTDRQRKSFESTPVSKLKEKLEKMLYAR
jgi:hypothetical protein